MRRICAAFALAVPLWGLPVSAGTPATCAPAEHAGGDWPMMGLDHGHSRHQPAESAIGPLEAPTLAPAWTFSANDASGVANNEITGYPVVAGGCVFVGSSTGHRAPGYVFAVNADSGQLVWKTKFDYGIYSTLTVSGGKVYAFVSRVGATYERGPECGNPMCGPYVAALDQATGAVLWETTVDVQQGSDAVSSPIVFDGLLWVGVSGTAAEGDESTRFDFRGASVILDAENGAPLAHTFSIPDADLASGFAGGAIWSTISIDTQTKYGFVGTGNPFNYEHEHPQTNAILKIDLDRSRTATFGQIVGSYKGETEEYFPQIGESFSCNEEDPIGFFLAGFECGRLDLDFGAAPQIMRIGEGTVVGEGQKSGVYHVVDPATMDMDPATNEFVWKQIVGFPSLVGGIVGTPAYDGSALYVPHTIAGYLTSLRAQDGGHRWVSPVGDAVHWGNPVTSANGVIYTNDLKGFLDAYDAATGAPLLHRPLLLGSASGTDPTFSWGGTSVARNTVYATVGIGLSSVGPNPPWAQMPDGFVVAFRPSL